MGITWKSALLLAACLGVVTSEYKPDVCTVIKESFGLVPPVLPTNFELRGEHVDHVQNFTMYQEMYFDFTNTRVKHMYLHKGIEHHLIFDYEVQQVVAYDLLHPGTDIKKDPLSHTCTASDLEEYKQFFGYVEDESSRMKMYNAFQALRFGGQYRFAYNGSERMSERGVLVEKFIGCVYDDTMDGTFNTTYLFTSKKNLGVGSSGGTLEKEVTGINNGLLSVPVKADFVGTWYNEDTDSYEKVNYTLNVFWFKGEPEFPPETFRLPPYMHCKNYRGRKEMPKFPTAFSTRLQKTTLKRDIFGKLGAEEVTSYEEIYYYQDKLLARRDFIPGNISHFDEEITDEFNNFSPVKTIYDFNEGLLYITNIPSGRCHIRPIIRGDYFEKPGDSLFVFMASPEEVFQMQRDEMEYKGKDFTRDIECDVWAGLYYDEILNATYVKETYISTNGWHEEVDEKVEYGVPVKHAVIQKELDGELMEGATFYSFLKFKTTKPEIQFFDVSNCIETQNYKDYALLLTISSDTEKLLFDYKSQFLETAQYYLSDVSQVMSPLRVQRLEYRQISISDPRPVLLFTLVDKIDMKRNLPFGQKGLILEDAIAKLQTFIDQNQFAIKFYAPGSKDMTLVPALRGSLYVKKADGDLTYYVSMESILPHIPEEHQRVMFDDTNDPNAEEDKGMTSGSLTLLALAMLFIGIGVGIAVMYLYLRQKKANEMEDEIHLSLKLPPKQEENTSTADALQ